MHYFKRNIGDYHKKAGRLSMLEHGAYTLLIDSCYDREEFPTEDQALDWCWARTDEEIAAVKFVLRKFFTLVDGVYVQKRIKEEIDRYHANAETNRKIAIKREANKKKAKKHESTDCDENQNKKDDSCTNRDEDSTNRARTETDCAPVQHEPPPNQEPRTKNHKPTTNKTNGDSDECAEWEKYWRAAFDEFWREYPRKVGKSAALKAWQKIGKRKPDYTLFEKILTALAAQCANNFAGRETQHIPHAATWINGERWNDDIEKPATPSGSKPEGRDIVGRLTGSDWADGFLNPPDVDALGHEVRH